MYYNSKDYEKEKLIKLDYIQEDIWKLQDIERQRLQNSQSSNKTPEPPMTEEERIELNLRFLQANKKLDIFLILVTGGGWLLFMFIRKKRRNRLSKKLAKIKEEKNVHC